MKKLGKYVLCFVAWRFVKLLFLWWVQAFDFSISTDNNNFDNTVKLYSNEQPLITVWGANWKHVYYREYSNSVRWNYLPFFNKSNPVHFISWYSQSSIVTPWTNNYDFAQVSPLTWFSQYWWNYYWNLLAYYSFSLIDLSFWVQAWFVENPSTVFPFVNYVEQVWQYEPNLKQLLIWNSFTNSYKYLTNTFSHIRLFWINPFSINLFTGESFVPKALQWFNESSVNYFWKDWTTVMSKTFLNAGAGAYFLWYWNSFSYVSDNWTIWNQTITRTDLNFNNYRDVWFWNHISSLKYSDIEELWYLLIPTKWFSQQVSVGWDQTLLLSKSNLYPDRIQASLYDCVKTSIESFSNDDMCPLVKNGWLSFSSTNTVSSPTKPYYNSSIYSWTHLLPFTWFSDVRDFSNSFVELFAWRMSDKVLDAYRDWSYLKISKLWNSYYNNNWWYVSFTIQTDTSVVPIDVQYSAGSLWVFVPLFSWWVAQTGQYVMPWQPWFIVSWWVSIVDVNWTGFVENNLTWWFRAFFCPYDQWFIQFKLSSIPWLWLLAWSSVDFDILKPLSCMFSSFGQWIEDMKENIFPEITFLTKPLSEMTWSNLLYSASDSSKNLFKTIMDLVLASLGLYLFYKRIK